MNTRKIYEENSQTTKGGACSNKKVGQVETLIVVNYKLLLEQKCLEENKETENKSKPDEKTKTNQEVKHYVLFVKIPTQKVIQGNLVAMCVLSPIH